MIINIYLIYEKYHRDFINFARYITQNKEIAFDLVQESYVSALEREEIFVVMNEYQIKSWFFTTIKNKNIDNIRKENRVLYSEDYEMFEQVESFEETVVMKGLLEKLPDKNKEVIILRYHMNLNSTEIGKILGISPSTVRSRLSASLKILKENI